MSAPPPNVTEVPGKTEVVGNSAEYVAVAIALLLVMVGMGYAFIQSLDEKNTALSVVFAVVIIGCSVVLYGTVRNLMGWLRAR